jgi:hypothetical protein
MFGIAPSSENQDPVSFRRHLRQLGHSAADGAAFHYLVNATTLSREFRV